MRLLLAFDGSAAAQTACDLVARLRLPRGTQVAVATVIDTHGMPPGAVDGPFGQRGAKDGTSALQRTIDRQLSTLAAALRAPDRSCETRILRGHPARELVEEAERWNADLVVVGNRGHGPLESILLGSVSAEVVDHSPCPVLVARHPWVHRLVVGVDGSPAAERAVATLAAWPLLRGVPALVVGVLEPISAWTFAAGGLTPAAVEIGGSALDEKRKGLTTAVDAAVSTLRRAGGLAEGELREGEATDQLLLAAEECGADLVVVGTRGLGMLGRLLLGSVARKVLLHSPSSILVVRPLRESIDVRQPVGMRAAT